MSTTPDSAARQPLLYPDHYAWYLLAGVLDIIVTYVIVGQLGGREVNAIANRLLETFGHWGLIGLKFATVIVVVLVCEWVGRQRADWGRKLATAAVVISALPVGIGLLQVAAWTHLLE